MSILVTGTVSWWIVVQLQICSLLSMASGGAPLNWWVSEKSGFSRSGDVLVGLMKHPKFLTPIGVLWNATKLGFVYCRLASECIDRELAKLDGIPTYRTGLRFASHQIMGLGEFPSRTAGGAFFVLLISVKSRAVRFLNSLWGSHGSGEYGKEVGFRFGCVLVEI